MKTVSLIALSLLIAAPVAAQDPVADLLRGETNAPAADAELDPAEIRTTAALNAEIVAQNDLAAQAEKAAAADQRQTYEAELEAYRRSVAETEAKAEADRQAYEAELARHEAEHQRRMALWREVSEACRRGETERCRVGRLALQNGG